MHAKSVYMLSSQLMSSLEKVSPGICPCFLSQKVDASEPENSWLPCTQLRRFDEGKESADGPRW